jgi:DNA modification methylase
MNYKEFLGKKQETILETGFEIKESDLNNNLFDFQKFIVKLAIKKGRYALFADCGLGKTIMQLEWAYQISKKENKKVLIVCPLAVVEQTKKEARKFNISVDNIDFINYEQLENIISKDYIGICLDESSILKNFQGAIRNRIIDNFKHTKYKLCCTATPSPNDIDELGNHSEFLNVMGFNEMRSMFFVNDMQTTQKWRLKKHGNEKFWQWVSNWAIMINNPPDIGFTDCNYTLPTLNIIEKNIQTKKKDDDRLFNDISVNATDYNAELRHSINERLEMVADIVNNSDESFIIWIKQNEEGDLLKKLIPEAIEVRGNDKPEYKCDRLLGFADNKFRVLITKTKIAQFGLNYQNCHNMIFASLDFSFESTYQAIRREWRFGQKEQVNVYMICTDTMQNIKDIFERKQNQFRKMQEMMIKYFTKGSDIKMKENNNNKIHEGQNFKIFNGDCCQEIKNIEDNSVGLSIFSPPFAELYTYSNHIEDMGNSKNSEEFYNHFKFLVKELKRVMMKGRNVCVHCMDIPNKKGVDGFIGLKDFSGDLIRLFQDEGFIYHTRITIWKDPVVQMQRTKALGLLHKQIKKDSAMSRVGLPDYVLVFRNDGDNEIPITHSNDDLNVDTWQKYASPVWMDINQSNTLQYMSARHENDEKHICPLQLDVIKRCIHLWSNKNETVFTPFMGIGSEVYQSILLNRYGIGIELKDSYFELAIQNCKVADLEIKQDYLF